MKGVSSNLFNRAGWGQMTGKWVFRFVVHWLYNSGHSVLG